MPLASNINVTPFVDVLLILLLVFMVTAPNLNNGFNVELPKASNSKDVAPKDTNIVLTIDKKGNLFLNENQITLLGLQKALEGKNSKQTVVFIKADANAVYGSVVGVLNKLTSLSFNNVSLITDK